MDCFETFEHSVFYDNAACSLHEFKESKPSRDELFIFEWVPGRLKSHSFLDGKKGERLVTIKLDLPPPDSIVLDNIKKRLVKFEPPIFYLLDLCFLELLVPDALQEFYLFLLVEVEYCDVTVEVILLENAAGWHYRSCFV